MLQDVLWVSHAPSQGAVPSAPQFLVPSNNALIMFDLAPLKLASYNTCNMY